MADGRDPCRKPPRSQLYAPGSPYRLLFPVDDGQMARTYEIDGDLNVFEAEQVAKTVDDAIWRERK
jgi:hypothetical protein